MTRYKFSCVCVCVREREKGDVAIIEKLITCKLQCRCNTVTFD